ncbi:MAG: HAD hydrolase-like protein [Patescibacteria group bacterium]
MTDNKVQLVAFDFNGTIIADTQACKEADDAVITAFGGNPPSLSEYRRTIIIPAVEFYRLHGCNRQQLESEPERMGEVFHGFYEPRVCKLRTRKGVRQVLSYLETESIPAIILSNHTKWGIEAQLKRWRLQHSFSAVLANTAGQTSMVQRNKLEKMSAFLADGRYNPAKCFIVGDSPEETEIGWQLGMKTVAISGGYYSKRRLRMAASGRGPHFPIISNMADLLPIIGSI